MFKILISSNAAALNSALTALDNTVTIEAEFGDILVKGSLYTLAHHGKLSANPPPCTLSNDDFVKGRMEIEAVGLSHIDLDALGGIMAVLGLKEQFEDSDGFWKLAGEVDVKGVHKLGVIKPSALNLRRLQAWHAWSEQNRVYPPRPAKDQAWGLSDERWVADVTKETLLAIATINSILEGKEELLKAGDDFAAKSDELNKASFVEFKDGVVYRRSEHFTNHLYTIPSFETVAQACVAYNPRTKAVTISLADPVEGLSCVAIAQQLWGKDAGGHVGIAGGPRSGLEEGEARHAFFVMQRGLQAMKDGCGFVALPRS